MPTHKRTIEWYNKNAQKYRDHLRVERAPFHFFLEKPAMRSMIPDIKGKSVLSIGCGSGDDTEYLRRRGAKRAVGIDISEELIDIAKEDFPKCEFMAMDMEKLTFRSAEFDFAYSSLALNYVSKLNEVLKGVNRILKPGSRFIFSLEHPTFGGMKRFTSQGKRSLLLGYSRDLEKGNRVIYGDYFKTDYAPGAIKGTTVYHRPLESIIDAIQVSGFQITDIKEPRPKRGMKKVEPSSYRVFNRMPIFMIIELKKARNHLPQSFGQ